MYFPCARSPPIFSLFSLVLFTYPFIFMSDSLPPTAIKLAVPNYQVNGYGRLDKAGEFVLTANVDSLTGGYQALKVQMNDLLKQVDAENKLVLDLEELQGEVERRQNLVIQYDRRIEMAVNQLKKLEAFLRRLGINPTDYHLEINSKVLEEELAKGSALVPIAATAGVSDPIPFDGGEEF